MQPCAVCGSVTVNTAGYCVQCGTYRGLPGQTPPGVPPQQAAPGYPHQGFPGQPGYPQQTGATGAYPQQAAYPQQTPGQPTYSAGQPGYSQPVSGASGYPSSGPPGYPTSGGGYPTAYPAMPSQSGRGRSFLIPLIALASTLVVLIIAIVIVVSVTGDDDPGPRPTADPSASLSPSPSASALAGPECVVGTWRITDDRLEINDEDEFGRVVFTGGEGAETTFDADGSATTDYGTGTRYQAVVKGQTVDLRLRGTMSFHYEADDKRIEVSSVKSEVEFRLTIGGSIGEWQDFGVSDAPSSYTCSGNSLKLENLLYTTSYSRVG